MRHPIHDDRMYGRLQGHWPSVCIIRRLVYTTSASNQRQVSSYTTVLTVKCRISPKSDNRPTDDEVRTGAVQSQVVQRVVKLNGLFLNILVRDMDALVDGIAYPIMGVEHDSQRFSTRLYVEDINP